MLPQLDLSMPPHNCTAVCMLITETQPGIIRHTASFQSSLNICAVSKYESARRMAEGHDLRSSQCSDHQLL